MFSEPKGTHSVYQESSKCILYVFLRSCHDVSMTLHCEIDFFPLDLRGTRSHDTYNFKVLNVWFEDGNVGLSTKKMR